MTQYHKNRSSMQLLLLMLLFTFSTNNSLLAQYKPDILGSEFLYKQFKMPNDYEGEVISTLIKRIPSDSTSHQAILYIHGFNDYFFQVEMANRFDSAGYHFYAVDLRKYGRSILPHQYLFNVRNLSEYFADIDSALYTIKKEGHNSIYLMGHSTGGLIAATYADAAAQQNQLGFEKILLNSPFLEINQSWFKKSVLIPLVSIWAKWFPNTLINQGTSTAYAESLLKTHQGEWEFSTDWKMNQSPAVTSSWIRAIHTAQKRIHRGLSIPIPILVLHSDKTIDGNLWSPAFQTGDAVLNVNDIAKYAPLLGPLVTDLPIANGVHDLILSSPEVRGKAYQSFFQFLTP